MTEWYDDIDPPGHKLDDEDLDLKWSELREGMRVRWKTPNWVRRGTISGIGRRFMLVWFDGFTEVTTIPDAKWYWVQAKLGNQQEHMVAIQGFSEKEALFALRYGIGPGKMAEVVLAETDWITPAEAANIIGCDSKVVRRMIRTGVLPATRRGGRWVILRRDALASRR